jgi:arginine decarboxylase-like protein
MATKTENDYETQARQALETWTETTGKVSEVIVKSALAAQERRTRLAQTLYESGVAELKSQAEANGALLDTLASQVDRQWQSQWQAVSGLAQDTLDAYTEALSAPYSSYQRWIETLTQAGPRR